MAMREIQNTKYDVSHTYTPAGFGVTKACDCHAILPSPHTWHVVAQAGMRCLGTGLYELLSRMHMHCVSVQKDMITDIITNTM